jgi:hypothetical protein
MEGGLCGSGGGLFFKVCGRRGDNYSLLDTQGGGGDTITFHLERFKGPSHEIEMSYDMNTNLW